MLGLGCTYGQGYFFSRPVGADEVAAMVATETAKRAAERSATPAEPAAPSRSGRFPRVAASVDASPA